MNCRKEFRVALEGGARLRDFDPKFAEKHAKEQSALTEIEECQVNQTKGERRNENERQRGHSSK
jgi:hypothetical protein